MDNYLFPIKVAFITFPIIAFILTIPFLLYQYRRYGYVNKWRVVILYSFLLYLITSFYLVILPLPENRDIKSMQDPDVEHYNLRPFRFVEDIRESSKLKIREPETYKFLLSEMPFLQVVFNILLLVPLGVYLRYYFKRSIKETIIISFLLSLFFEITQLTGIYGIYNAPYRLFDVDDLFLNTLGGFIGYRITPLLTFVFPDSDKLDENVDLEEIEAGYVRRLVSYLIDTWIIELLIGVDGNLLSYGLMYFLYFIAGVYITNGRTVGKWLTGLRVVGQDEKLRFKEVFIRYGLLFYGYFGVNKLINNIIAVNETTSLSVYMVVLQIFHLVFNIAVWIHVLISIIGREKLFYEKASNTYIEVSDESFSMK